MREILFRAKRIDNGQWVEGLLIHICMCFINEYEEIDKEHVLGIQRLDKSYEIDPSTLCEFTGLTDKNNNRIWENDIVLTQEFYDKPYAKNRKNKKHIGVVEYKIYGGNFYNSETGNYDKRKEYNAKWIVKVKDYGKFVHSSWGDFYDCEVIGNVFDNPELMEGTS